MGGGKVSGVEKKKSLKKFQARKYFSQHARREGMRKKNAKGVVINDTPVDGCVMFFFFFVNLFSFDFNLFFYYN